MPCYNAAQYLADQLAALCRQTSSRPWELVVSDNGSTDASLEILERYRESLPRLVVIDSSDAPGPGAARNAGVRAASGEFILFCDADDVVAPDWLEAMATALERSDFVAANIDHERLNKPHPFRARPTRPGLLQSLPPFLPYTLGGAMGVRRAAHERIGGFDERYRDSCEDRDYCYRLQLAGIPLTFVPDAILHYRHRTAVLDIYRQTRSYARGHVQIYREYRDLGLGRPSVLRSLAHWVAMPVRLLPALRSKERFTSWVVRLGWQVGRAQGCLRYRIWAP
jgi:GT2 family glycosyltransferase